MDATDGAGVRIPARLLTGDRSQPKMQKSARALEGWRFAILMLTPGRVAIPATAWPEPVGLRAMLRPRPVDGYAVQCVHASAGCLGACLGPSEYSPGTGHAAIPGSGVRAARDARTVALWTRPADFMAGLVADIARHERAAARHGDRLAVRLNGTADLPWWQFPCERDGRWYANLFEAFPEVQFYDYTKVTGYIRRAAGIPNYHATFSLSETNDRQARDVLRSGGAVAVVIRGGYEALPMGADGGRTWGGFRAVDGDAHDGRFLDGDGPVIVALRVKGSAQRRGDAGGFFRDPAGALEPSRVAEYAAIPAGAIGARRIVDALQDARDAAESAALVARHGGQGAALQALRGYRSGFAHEELRPDAEAAAAAFLERHGN